MYPVVEDKGIKTDVSETFFLLKVLDCVVYVRHNLILRRLAFLITSYSSSVVNPG